MVRNQPHDNIGSHAPQSPEQSSGGSDETISGRISSQVRSTGRSFIGNQKQRASDELESIGEVVHETAERLHGRDDHTIAEYVDSFADQIERAAEYIRSSDPGQLFKQANEFARRRPEVVLGGALLLGLVAARFLKASSEDSSQRSSHIRGGDEPFRGGAVQSGGGFETRMSEAGPVATPRPKSPTQQTIPPGSTGAGSAGGSEHGLSESRPGSTAGQSSKHESRFSEDSP